MCVDNVQKQLWENKLPSNKNNESLIKKLIVCFFAFDTFNWKNSKGNILLNCISYIIRAILYMSWGKFIVYIASTMQTYKSSLVKYFVQFYKINKGNNFELGMLVEWKCL